VVALTFSARRSHRRRIEARTKRAVDTRSDLRPAAVLPRIRPKHRHRRETAGRL